MDTLFAIIAVVIGAIFIALALNYVSSRNEKVKKPRQPKEKTAQKPAKKEKKDKKDGQPKKKAANANKKKKLADIKYYDGEAEDDDAQMLEFLRGTTDQQIKEAREERKKKAREDAQRAEKLKVADKQTGKQAAAAKKKPTTEEEEAEFKLVKEKKPKKAAKVAPVAAPVDPNAPVVEDAEPKAEKKERKPKQKKFFKDNLAKELKFIATGKEEPEEEEAPKGKGKPRKTVEGEQATNDSKDRPAGQRKERPPREVGEDGEELDGDRKPRKPREAPPPPPRPLSLGVYEAPSLDAMLTAISSFYGPAVKENFFSKLPSKALTQVIRNLNLKDVISLTRVNHFLSKFCREDRIWRFLCERDFSLKIDRNSKKRFKNVYKEEYSHRKNPKQKI